MRRGSIIVPVAAAVVLTLMVPIRSAGAMTLSAPAALATARDTVGAIERVRTVCQKEWDGYEWQSRCRVVRNKYSRSAQIRRLQRRMLHYLRHW